MAPPQASTIVAGDGASAGGDGGGAGEWLIDWERVLFVLGGDDHDDADDRDSRRHPVASVFSPSSLAYLLSTATV